jgi:hypothetical protein
MGMPLLLGIPLALVCCCIFKLFGNYSVFAENRRQAFLGFQSLICTGRVKGLHGSCCIFGLSGNY